jgi:putative transposase
LIYGAIRKYLGEMFHELAKRKGVIIEEGHLMKDHIHICLSIPLKFVVSNVVGYLKEKSAISIAKNFRG